MAEKLEVVRRLETEGSAEPLAEIAAELKTWSPQAIVQRRDADTVIVTVSDDQLLTEGMGSAGSACYLASLTASLTSIPGIDSVWLDIQEGSHAAPGRYSRASFLAMFNLLELPVDGGIQGDIR